MPVSHHSHSGQFCRHASGTLEEVVQEAIRQGFRVYGLAEHVPRHRLIDLYPEEVGEEPILIGAAKLFWCRLGCLQMTCQTYSVNLCKRLLG